MNTGEKFNAQAYMVQASRDATAEFGSPNAYSAAAPHLPSVLKNMSADLNEWVAVSPWDSLIAQSRENMLGHIRTIAAAAGDRFTHAVVNDKKYRGERGELVSAVATFASEWQKHMKERAGRIHFGTSLEQYFKF